MNVTDDIKQQQRVPWICKECWEYLKDNEPGDTCRHCKASRDSMNFANRFSYRHVRIVLWLIALFGAVSVLCDIFLWRPL
jgi:hypothetical protein